MRKRWLWEVGMALLVGLSAAAMTARAGDDDESPPRKVQYGRGPGLMDRLFGARPKPAEKKPEKETTDKPIKDKPAKPVADSPVAIRAREEVALMRRIQVCDRLKNLANQINDEALYRRAEELDQKAWAVYRQRTAHLASSNAAAETDEEVLDRHLGDKTAAKSDNLATGGAKKQDRTSQAAVREVKP